MSLLPYIEDEPGDLCWECGRESDECICGFSLPEDFDPLDEDEDAEWNDYDNDLGEIDEQDTSTVGN